MIITDEPRFHVAIRDMDLRGHRVVRPSGALRRHYISGGCGVVDFGFLCVYYIPRQKALTMLSRARLGCLVVARDVRSRRRDETTRWAVDDTR